MKGVAPGIPCKRSYIDIAIQRDGSGTSEIAIGNRMDSTGKAEVGIYPVDGKIGTCMCSITWPIDRSLIDNNISGSNERLK